MPIQGPSSRRPFCSIQPCWYSRKKTPIWGIRGSHLLIKRSKQYFYQLYSNYGRKFGQSNRQIPNFSSLPLFFQNNSRTFSFQGQHRNLVHLTASFQDNLDRLVPECHTIPDFIAGTDDKGGHPNNSKKYNSSSQIITITNIPIPTLSSS